MVLYWLAKLVGLLPWPILRGLGSLLGQVWRLGQYRPARAALRSLEIAFPEMSAEARASMQREVLRNTGRQTFETLRFWTRDADSNLRLLREDASVALFDAALASGRGVIVAAPHHGNWELLNQWLARRTSLAILYAPPEQKWLDDFLRRVRQNNADANRVEQVRAGSQGVRLLLKRLQSGGVVGILPDQQPKLGDGVWAPFFGMPALTMTLLGRLAARTGAQVLYAWCEREGKGPHFVLRFATPPEAIYSADAETSATALNAGLEALIRQAPAQYQWTYKRWTQQPEGVDNPYWPDCY